MEEAGAKAVANDFIVICDFEFVDGVLVLADFFFDFDDDLIKFLSSLEQFGEVVDADLVFFGDLNVRAYLLHVFNI